MNIQIKYGTRAYISVDTLDELVSLQNRYFVSGDISAIVYEVDTSNMVSSSGYENSDLSIDIYGYKIMPFKERFFYDGMDTTNFYLNYPDAVEFDSRTKLSSIPNIWQFSAQKVKTIPENIFFQCFRLRVNFPSVTTILSGAFQRCLTINTDGVSNVQYLYDKAFADAYIDYPVEFPELLRIDGDPFYNCRFLSKVHCSKLKKANWEPDNIEFYNLSDLEKFEYLRRHGNIKYYNPKIKLFDKCPMMRYIYFPNLSVETIGSNMFSHLSALRELELGYLSNIASNSFKDLSDLEWISFAANNPITIGDSAFKNCRSLSSFTAQNIFEIDNNAFDGCIDLKEFNCESIEYFNSKIDGELEEWNTPGIYAFNWSGSIPENIKSMDVDLAYPWLNFNPETIEDFEQLSSVYAIESSGDRYANLSSWSIDNIISGSEMHPVIAGAIRRNLSNHKAVESEEPENVANENLSEDEEPTTIEYPEIKIYVRKSFYDGLIAAIDNDPSYDVSEEDQEAALSIFKEKFWNKEDTPVEEDPSSENNELTLIEEPEDDEDEDPDLTEEEEAILERYSKSLMKDQIKKMFDVISVTDFKHPDESQYTPTVFKYTELDYTGYADVYTKDIIDGIHAVATVYQIDPPTEPVIGKLSLLSVASQNDYMFSQPIDSFGVKGTRASIKGNVYQYRPSEDSEEISAKAYNSRAIAIPQTVYSAPTTSNISVSIDEDDVDESMITSDNERDFLLESIVTNQNNLSVSDTIAFKNYTSNASEYLSVSTKITHNSITVNAGILNNVAKATIALFKENDKIGEKTFDNVEVGKAYSETFSGLTQNTNYRIEIRLYDSNGIMVAETFVSKATTKLIRTVTFANDKTNYIKGTGKKLTYEDGYTLTLPNIGGGGMATNNSNTVFYGWTTIKNIYGNQGGKTYKPNAKILVNSNLTFYPVITKASYVASDISRNISVTAKKGSEGTGGTSNYTVSTGIPNKTFNVQTSVVFSAVNSKIKYFEAIICDRNKPQRQDNRYVVVKKDGTAKANTEYSKTIPLSTNAKGDLVFTIHGHIGNQSGKLGSFSSTFKFKVKLSKGCICTL